MVPSHLVNEVCISFPSGLVASIVLVSTDCRRSWETEGMRRPGGEQGQCPWLGLVSQVLRGQAVAACSQLLPGAWHVAVFVFTVSHVSLLL